MEDVPNMPSAKGSHQERGPVPAKRDTQETGWCAWVNTPKQFYNHSNQKKNTEQLQRRKINRQIMTQSR